MASIRLDHVTKVYPGGAVALDGVDLTVRDGELLVLVGPSGCGKSTVLRIIAGIEDASGGSVEVDGAVLDGLPPKMRDVAMVFQNYALYPHMTVGENVDFALRLRHVPAAERSSRVDEIAGLLEIVELLQRKPKALSGGQRQRVAMGRALVRNPRILLMDEPLSNLDAKLRVTMRAELRRLHERFRTTTVYVTHDQVEAMTLGDRIAVLHEGRIQQIGPPHELYHRPANLFVARFIGSPAMNVAPARLVGEPASLVLGDGARWPVPADWSVDQAAGRDVCLGLRPDALTWPAPAGWPRLAVTVAASEFLGSVQHVLFRAPGSDLSDDPAAFWTARVSAARDAAPGTELTFGVDVSQLHLFDGASGTALLPARDSTATATATAEKVAA
ncbi:sn-glycerol-3-phosphate ABC transporter ATP-binding protein UgpC [Asanoa sp. NPDC049573]|uniref:ABC transporter ATP-binding protein n=1 Tax=Asanoa sp. NPDC049573 TaxID=3155396 RepID=UPI00343A908F